MWSNACRSGVIAISSWTLLIILILGVCSTTQAGDGEWSFRLEPVFMDVYGHDQHVLTIHEIQLEPLRVDKTAVTLDTEDGVSYRGEFRYSKGKWAFGADVSVLYTDQGTEDRTASASGSIDEVVFEMADRSFSSTGADDVLLYTVLEDTSLQTWTVDLYALRSLSEGSKSSLWLQLGLRNADFDNDYRALAGIHDVGGRRFDASSNYDRMIGPLIGLLGNVEVGKSVIEGYIGQSVLLGSVELTNMSRDFTGPLGNAVPVEAELPTTYSQETFSSINDVAIPVTDLRVRWTYSVSKVFGFGLGVHSSTWWDVPVPPGVIPVEGGNQVMHENTLVFFGVGASVDLRF